MSQVEKYFMKLERIFRELGYIGVMRAIVELGLEIMLGVTQSNTVYVVRDSSLMARRSLSRSTRRAR